MKTRHKVQIKAYCKITAYVTLDKNNALVDIEEIEDVDEILGDEEILKIIQWNEQTGF